MGHYFNSILKKMAGTVFTANMCFSFFFIFVFPCAILEMFPDRYGCFSGRLGPCRETYIVKAVSISGFNTNSSISVLLV